MDPLHSPKQATDNSSLKLSSDIVNGSGSVISTSSSTSQSFSSVTITEYMPESNSLIE